MRRRRPIFPVALLWAAVAAGFVGTLELARAAGEELDGIEALGLIYTGGAWLILVCLAVAATALTVASRGEGCRG